MNKLTIIIPVNECEEAEKVLLKRAVDSCASSSYYFDSSVVIVCPKEIKKKAAAQFKGNKFITVLENSGKTDFCSQVNFAVSNIDSKYFSILEIDDYYSDSWFKHAAKHINSSDGSISVYLPLTNVVEHKSGEVIGFINEAVLASAFSNELGYIDNQCLEDFMNFNLTGGIFDREVFVNSGMLKPSIKLTFWYEYLLRVTKEDQKIYVIPRIGYNHTIERENSLSETYQKTMDEKEAEWWFELAKKECYFKKDREKTYE